MRNKTLWRRLLGLTRAWVEVVGDEAADGVVVSGQSTVNQANITGESLPVDKNLGDEVFNGTNNITGALDIRVNKAGAETTLGRVQQLILGAERTRIPLMRLIDQ